MHRFLRIECNNKKNKHFLLLICILLDLLAGAKRYTKLDLIAAYNLLRIKHGNK